VTGRERSFADLASAILDGIPIDWPSPESQASDDDRQLLEQLRLLSAVADTHRHYREATPSVASSGAEDVRNDGPHWGRLRVLERIGGGTGGVVYRAWDPRLERDVALKLICAPSNADAEWMAAVISEGRHLARVRHPGVVAIYDAEQIGSWVGLTMEYLRGRTLEARLAAEGSLPVDVAVAAVAQVCRALSAVHESGLVHRDVKASNVIETSDGRAVLVDFGTGHMHADGAPTPAGTPLYVAPEVLRGDAATPRSDVYSVGVLLYRLLTGAFPVAAASLAELLAAHARGSQPDVREVRPELSKSLATVVNDALSPQPDRRPASAGDLANALEAALARPRPIGVRARRVAAALAVLALVIAGFAAARPWLGSTTPPQPSSEAPTPSVSPQALAVLPFIDLKPASDTSYLSFSLADALITHLSRLGALDVRAATAIYKYRGATTTPKQIAGELRVGRVITGTYVNEGDSLRVTAEMVDAVNDVLLYKEAFEVSHQQLAAVADQVARHVVEALHMSVSPREIAAWQADVSRDPVAYQLFLRGRDDYEATRRDSGAAFFERAVAIEPSFARAWAYLGSAYAVNASLRFGGRADYDRARRALDTAMRLDPSDIVPRLAMANVLIESNRVEDAVPLLRGVLAETPRSADVLWELAYAYRFAGLLDESQSASERAAAMEPFALAGANIPLAQLYRGEYQRFLDGFRLDSQSAYQQFYTGLAHYYLKRFAQASLAFDHAYSLDQSMLHTRVGKAFSALISGDRNGAAHVLQLTELESTARDVSDAEALFRIAEAYAALGDSGAALRVLGRSIEGGFFCYPYFARDPLLESIRSVPEFQPLLERARERHEAFRRRLF
jgi:serine/threonine protein kinase/tetratricopeptide (TPR) repeat protein